MAGSETQGLRYSTIKTPEKHWLHWKESDAHPDADDNPFRELMDTFLPQWRTYRDTLNRAPLAYEDWGY